MTRQRLSNRRKSENISFEHAGVNFVASVSRFPDGKLAEIFLGLEKPGGSLDDLSRDIAVTTSLALQFGATVETIRAALTRSPDGGAAGPLGRLLDVINQEARA